MTTVPEVALELIKGVGVGMVSFQGVTAVGDAVLAPIGCILNGSPSRPRVLWVWGLQQTVLLSV